MADEGLVIRGISVTEELYDLLLFLTHSFVRPAGKVGRNGMPQGENSYPVEGTHQNDLGRSRTCSAI